MTSGHYKFWDFVFKKNINYLSALKCLKRTKCIQRICLKWLIYQCIQAYTSVDLESRF